MNKSFYDTESKTYSVKRYEGKRDSYIKYFFQNRLNIVLSLIQKYFKNESGLKLIDIGCADGVMTRTIGEKFGEVFSTLVGTDISRDMVDTARLITTDPKISYMWKDNEAVKRSSEPASLDVALALGYVAPKIFDEEMAYVKKLLKKGGIYIISLADRNSIHARLKLKDVYYRSDYLSYKEYEEMLKKHFDILERVPNGLFVPKLWAVPSIGRLFQPIIDKTLRRIVPNLYHEMVYVVRLK